jgi:hypothetical protein
MRTKILIIVFLIGIFSVVNAQKSVDKNEMVGFACYFAGQPSKTVEKYTQKLNNENYKWISKRLESENKAEKYMSVIILEKLTEIRKYKLNETELKLISEIKQSDELVSICSGCTYFEKVSLKELLTDDKKLFAKNWLDRNIKME